MRGSRGASLVETLVTLLLFLLVMHLLLEMALSVQRGVSKLVARSERLAAVRVARVVLGIDGGHADGTLQLHGGREGDSLTMRVVRGGAVGCGMTGAVWTAVVEGVREPDPAKDSITVTHAGGERSVHALTELRPPERRCPPGVPGRAVGLVLDPSPGPDPVLGRYFERGSYHLWQGALRYRRGGGGRQPLTAEVMATPSSGFEVVGDAVRARLHFPGGGTAPWVLPSGREGARGGRGGG